MRHRRTITSALWFNGKADVEKADGALILFREVDRQPTDVGVEVDFVWEGPKEDVPIEVKWTERPRPEDARHLEKFLEQHPSRARRGLPVCRCPEPQQLTDRVKAIGWDRL